MCNYIAAFLTLNCNLGCSYCINNDQELKRNRDEISSDQWIEGLNRLKIRPDLAITLEGGEPTSKKGVYEILEKVQHPLDLLTNLQFDVNEFIKNVDPKWLNRRDDVPGYKSIRASYHPEKMQLEDTIEKAVRLQNAGFKIGLFSLNIPESTEDNMRMAEAARENRIYFFIKDFLGERDGRLFGAFKYPNGLDGIAKKADCRIKELLIDPQGDIYRCHKFLYQAKDPKDNLLNENLKIEYDFKPCNDYGFCNPCDLKLKTNRFLQMGTCSVEINEN